MPFLEKPQAKVFYEYIVSAADAPTITLLNGHTRSSADFRLLARHLVEKGVSCLLIDNRGAGRSETTGPFTLNDMCQDVVDTWDALQLSSSHLLGVSMGGFLAMRLAATQVERVESLILVSTASQRKWMLPVGGAWVQDYDQVAERLQHYFATDFPARNALLFKTMVNQTLKAIEQGRFAERAGAQREAVREFDSDIHSYLKQIRARTLVIHGDQDRVVDIQAARELATEIPGAKLQVIENVGHLLLAEAPKVLYSTVADFVLS